jgi:zinc/manganese transport system permease protein
MEMIALYKWTLLGGTLAGAALALIGAQLAARNQAVQSLVVSQAASFGVTIALIFRTRFEDPHSHINDILPLLLGSVSTALFYGVCEFVVQKRWASRNTHFIGIFGLLMALSYTVVSMVPSLESHMAAAYFGDLTVATDHETIIIACLAAAVLIVLVMDWRRISAWSFEAMTFGQFLPSRADRLANIAFLVGGMLMISASVHILGLLFTLSCLFLPIIVVSKMQSGFRGLAFRLILGAIAGILSGFVISLWQGSLPTVPTITITLLFTSWLAGFVPA